MAQATALSGFPEWLPEVELVQEHLISLVRQQYELHGFTPIRTRSLESLSDLIGEGGDTDKEIYGVHRLARDEDDGGQKLGLHFDLTVPFARYVAENQGKLVFPFRRYQIQPAWRGERPQLGRFREFIQADIDVIAQNNLDIRFDAELLSVLRATLSALPIPSVKLMINNRKLLEGFYRGLGVDDLGGTLRIVDKLPKIGAKGVTELLGREGRSAEQIEGILKIARLECASPAELEQVRALGVTHPLLDQGLDELALVLERTQAAGAGTTVAALHIARGLDYYTGTVVEGIFEAHPNLGAVCSGGRYDNLASKGSSVKLPGVGVSIGITRIMAYCEHLGLLKQPRKNPAVVLVVVHSDADRGRSDGVATALRARGIPTLVSDAATAYGKQIRLADRLGIPYVWFPAQDGGEHEVKDIRGGAQGKAELETWTPDPALAGLRL